MKGALIAVAAFAAVLLVAFAAVSADAETAPEIGKGVNVEASGSCGAGSSGVAGWTYKHVAGSESESTLTISSGSVAKTSAWTIATLKIGDDTIGEDLGSYKFSDIGKSFESLEIVLAGDITLVDQSALASLRPIIVSDDEGCKKVPDSVFKNCISLRSVSLVNAGSIGKSSFEGCTGLVRLTLAGTTSIGEAAFKGCKIPSADLPDSLKTVGKEAFADITTLESTRIPSGATFGDSAFSGCTALDAVTLAPGTTSIGTRCFRGCTSLVEIELPASLKTIGVSAFTGCTALTELKLPDSLTILGDSAFEGCTKLEKVEIQSDAGIETSAFKGCTALKTVSIGSRVKSIGSSAFEGCTALLSFDVAAAEVDPAAFKGCTKLAELKATASKTYSADGGILYSGDRSTLFMAPPAMNRTFQSGDLPSSVRTVNLDYSTNAYFVDDSTTAYDVRFVAVVQDPGAIGVRYSSLGMSVCEMSRSVHGAVMSYTLYSGWTYSGTDVQSTGADVSGGDGRISIDMTAPSCIVYPMGLRTLTYAQLDRVTSMDGWPSEWMLDLQGSTYAEQGRVGTVKDVDSQKFRATAYNGRDPSAVLNGSILFHGVGFQIVSVKLALDSYGPLTDLVLGEGVGIPDHAFANSPKLTSVSADHVPEVGASAFRNCTSLTTASFLSCAVFGDYALDNCRSLGALSLGAPAVSFGTGALWGCSSLGVLTIGSSTDVSGADGVPVVHTDASAADCTFYAGDGCILVGCGSSYKLLVSSSSDRSAARTYEFYSGTAVIPLEDSMYAWLEPGTQQSGFKVVYDYGIGDGYTEKVVQEGAVAEELAPPAVPGYTFLRWESGSEAYDFRTPVTGTLLLTAVYQKDVSENGSWTVLVGMIATALLTAAVIPAVFRRFR